MSAARLDFVDSALGLLEREDFSLSFLNPFLVFLIPLLTPNCIDWGSGGTMNDLVYVALTLLFFALTYGFIVVCERLMEDKP